MQRTVQDAAENSLFRLAQRPLDFAVLFLVL